MSAQESLAEFQGPELEKPKESFFARNGHIIFWGTVIALPTMNMVAAVINAKTVNKGLEIEELKLQIEQLKQAATPQT